MEFTCYLHPAWKPLIRPAGVKRDWMEAATEAFPHRCLPLNIANAHGWEIASPCGVEASWNGGPLAEDVTVRVDAGADPISAPVAIFGQGVLTFHVMGIFRTPPGWNLWIGGPPNQPKDAIAPLTGVVETDWSPFTFTMNWQFTRPGQTVRFEPNETFATIFPIERGAVERFEPRFAPLASDPELERQFHAWSAARDAFHLRMQREPPANPSDKWQKHYYRGVDIEGRSHVADHRPKLRVKPFRAGPSAPPPQATRPLAVCPAGGAGVRSSAEAERRIAQLEAKLAKRDWMLETMELQRVSSPVLAAIPRRAGIDRQTFLDQHYAVSRPAIVSGMLAGWPALTWTPEALRRRVGDAEVEYQGGRAANPAFEEAMPSHTRRGPFSGFIDQITAPGAGNDVYMTAYNAARNAAAFAPLAADLRPLDAFLTPTGGALDGMPWIGAAGSFTPLHHDLTNNLIVQVVGRKRFRLAPPSETAKLGNERGVYSDVRDLDDPKLDLARFPRLKDIRLYDVVLEPGEILFVPVGWWHQVRALDFSVTLTYTNFPWPNHMAQTYPPDPAA
jgi:hypothetical protein